MNYLFKAAAGALSAFVITAGALLPLNTNTASSQTSPESGSLPELCESKSDCICLDNAQLQKLIGECESTADIIKVLLDNNLCNKDDLSCIIDNDSCTIDDVKMALENCDTDSFELVSVIENACSKQNGNCTESTAANCEDTECAADTQSTLCSDEKSFFDSSETNIVSEQTSDNNQECYNNSCTTISDSDNDSANVECQDNNCNSDTSCDLNSSESDCSSQAAQDSSTDIESVQKNSYHNINDILKALGISITENTTYDSDNNQSDIPNDTKTTERVANDTDSNDTNTAYAAKTYQITLFLQHIIFILLLISKRGGFPRILKKVSFKNIVFSIIHKIHNN